MALYQCREMSHASVFDANRLIRLLIGKDLIKQLAHDGVGRCLDEHASHLGLVRIMYSLVSPVTTSLWIMGFPPKH